MHLLCESALFNTCGPLALLVTVEGERVEEIELTEERVRTMAEKPSPIRGLYSDASGLYWLLSVSVTALGPAFDREVEFYKVLRDPVTGPGYPGSHVANRNPWHGRGRRIRHAGYFRDSGRVLIGVSAG